MAAAGLFLAAASQKGFVMTEREPVAAYLDGLFHQALSANASDMHIEPRREHYSVRLRCDGILRETDTLSNELGIRLVTRLKTLAELNIAEKRLPQDGRFQPAAFPHLDVRLNSCPTIHGEKLALRLLGKAAKNLSINQLGMTPNQSTAFLNCLSQPQGLILITGPTGSGKTVTLAAALQYLNSNDRQIISIEDPVEIEIPGINQVSIQPHIGLNFATVLRASLRQDPDVLMIGEIRDQETASIAIQAAQTGHLVLATLHANNTQDSITRLLTIGMDAYQIAQSLRLIVAQRLVRKCCAHCFHHTACEYCHDGYNGRIGIFECLGVTPLKQAPWINLTAPPIDHMTLQKAAILLLQQQLTTNPEIERVLGNDAP